MVASKLIPIQAKIQPIKNTYKMIRSIKLQGKSNATNINSDKEENDKNKGQWNALRNEMSYIESEERKAE